MHKFSGFLTIASIFLLTACSTQAPKYELSYDNVKKLENTGAQITIEPFSALSVSQEKVSIRGTNLESPHGDNLIDYIEYAITAEFKKAGIFSSNSSKKLFAEIRINRIWASGVSEGRGQIDAEFSIINRDETEYNNTIVANKIWDSSFLGAIAITNAAQAYKMLVQELLSNLYSDEKFIKALSK